MPMTGPMLEAACSNALTTSTSSATRARLVSLAVVNYVAQYAAGAPIDDSTGPFTEFAPTRLPQVTLGAGAAAPVVTLTYTPIEGGDSRTQSVTGVAGATVKFTQPVQTITRVQTDIDPVDVMDIQAGDTWVSPAPRSLFPNVAGDVICRGVEDDLDVTLTLAAGIPVPMRADIIRATGTTATVVLLW